MPKATAGFDADDSRLSGALARINGKMLALQSRIAKFAAAFIPLRWVAHLASAGFDQFRDALEVGAHLDDVSTKLGVTDAPPRSDRTSRISGQRTAGSHDLML